MKQYFRITALLLLIIVLAACGGQAPADTGSEDSGSQAGEASPAETSNPIVNEESAGQTINLKLGDRVDVFLSPDYDWTYLVTPDMVVGDAADAVLAEGAMGQLEAKFAGKATFQATGKPLCKQDDPPCDTPQKQFTVTFVVARE